MAFNRMLAVLLAGFALTAVSAAPCDTVPKTTAGPLTNGEIAGIAVGTAAGVAAIGGAVGGIVGQGKEEKAGAAEAEVNARESAASIVEPFNNQPAASIAGLQLQSGVEATANATAPPKVTTTTTVTALDSSASSGSQSSDSLASGATSSNSLSSDSTVGSSDSSLFFGSTASGSWGSALPIWLWLTLLACCFLAAGAGAAMRGKKTTRTVKKSKAKPAAAEPVVTEDVPLMAEIPPLMPIATTSLLQPSYSVVAAPATTAYQYAAAPMTTAAPVLYEQAVAAPVVYETVAQPMFGTAAYAAPTAFAAPVAYAYP